VAEIPAPEGTLQKFRADLRGDGQKPGFLAHQLLDPLSTGATYKFLHVHEVEKRPRVIFRQLDADRGGLNYIDFVLARRPDGLVHGVDFFDYSHGELFSVTSRRAYVLAVLRVTQTPFARARGWEKEYLAHYAKVEQMNALARSPRPRHHEVLMLYDQLPSGLQKDKTILLMRVDAARRAETGYGEAIRDFRSFHPGDPCVETLSIDYYLKNGERSKALAAIDNVEKTVGGDPYLDVVRASAHLEAKDAAAARKAALRALEAEPMLQAAYWRLVSASLLEKNFDETVRRLREIEDRFQIGTFDLQAEEYDEFVKSPQYEAWARARKKT
jgi:hypothetical protein